MSGVQGYPTDPTQSTGTVGTSGGNSGTTITEDAMTVKSFNNALRGMVGDTGAWRDDISGKVTTTGSANTYTAAIPSQPSTVADGNMFSAIINVTNTGASTITPNAGVITAYPILYKTAALTGGELVAGQVYRYSYDANGNGGSSPAWIVENPTPLASDINNDSGVTGANVGAALDQLDTDKQDTLTLISQVDAEAGTATEIEGFSALRVAQAIAALSNSAAYETEIALLNMGLADALNVAQFIGDTGNRYADSFDALTYIDNAGATNLDISEAGALKPTVATGTDQTETHTSATQNGKTASASGEQTGYEAWRAVNDVTSSNPSGVGAWWVTSLQTSGWWQYDFGTGTTIVEYRINPGDSFATHAPKTFQLYGSNTGAFSGEETELDSRASETGWSGERSYTISSPASYRYYRLDIDSIDGGSTLMFDEIALIGVGATNNMTVETTGLSAATAPSTMRAYLTFEAIDSVTLNTDLTVRLSRDGGTTWAAATLSELFTTGSNKVLDTGAVDVSGQPSGTTPTMEIATANNKSVKIHSHYVYWS